MIYVRGLAVELCDLAHHTLSPLAIRPSGANSKVTAPCASLLSSPQSRRNLPNFWEVKVLRFNGSAKEA